MHANTRRTTISRTCVVAVMLAAAITLATVCRGQVTFETYSSQTINSGTSLLLIKPPLTATGDLMIAVVVVDDDGGVYNTNDLEAPTGWTLINRGPCPTTDGGSCAVGVWWRIVPPGEPGSYVFSWTGGSTEPAAGAILRYSGTDSTNPIGEVTTTSGRDQSNPPTGSVAPSITTTVDGSVVLRVLGNDRLGPYNPDAGHSSRSTECNSSPDPNKVCLALADTLQATAGSAGGMSWSTNASGTNVYWRSLSIEVTPPQPKGDLEVYKHTLPDGGTEMFDFTATGLTPSSFDLMDDESRVFSDLLAGSGLYSVSETVPADWTRISYCDIGFPGNVEVVDASTTQCHFINVDETQVARCDMVGAVDTSIGSGALYSGFGAGLRFDALAPFVLRAVDVYPAAAGDVVVNLKKGGALLASRTIAVNPMVAGERTRIELDLPVPAGSGYEFDATGTTTGGLFRNNGSTFPYPYSGEFVEITSSTLSNSFYYFFYDWEVERMDAVGPSTKEFGGGGYREFNYRMEFDTTEPTRIHAVHVYPEVAGDVAVELLNSADVVLDSVVQNVPDSVVGRKTPILLDFLVPAGSNYALRLDTLATTTRLWRNSSGTVYPFTTSTLSIEDNSCCGGYYYFFYDWLFTPARLGWDVHLHDLTVDKAMTVRACGTATLGPDMDLVFPADVDVEAGESIVLESPFESGDNVLFGMAIDPALLPD